MSPGSRKWPLDERTRSAGHERGRLLREKGIDRGRDVRADLAEVTNRVERVVGVCHVGNNDLIGWAAIGLEGPARADSWLAAWPTDRKERRHD
jgi:hypothetical protein